VAEHDDTGHRRRDLKITGSSAAAIGLVAAGVTSPADANAFAYEPYYTDDQLTTVVTSCAHNCGSRHMLVAHKKGDVIVRLSSDDGRYQKGGFFGKDTTDEPQLRALAVLLPCPHLRRSDCSPDAPWRARRGKQAPLGRGADFIARKMVELKRIRPDGDPRPGLRRHLLLRAAQVGSDRGIAGALPRHVRLPQQFMVGAVLSGHNLLQPHDLRHHRGRQRG
jgi:hypothetical protein